MTRMSRCPRGMGNWAMMSYNGMSPRLGNWVRVSCKRMGQGVGNSVTSCRE